MSTSIDGSTADQIAFYDVETTIPQTDMIEFGAVCLDKSGLYERESYYSYLLG